MLRGILIKVGKNENTLKLLEIDGDKLSSFYEILNCECFDIPTRKIGNKYYSIYCDDEGLFKSSSPSAVTVDKNGKVIEQIYGNIFIVNFDNEYSCSLTNSDIENIHKNIVVGTSKNGKQRLLVLLNVE